MRRCLVPLTLIAACGDDAPPAGPRPLVPDPAVETGCVPHVEGRARIKVVACAEELAPGALAAGRLGDFVLENGHVRVIVRGPGAGYYLHGTSGGGLIDAVRKTPSGMTEDLVKEVLPLVDLAAGAFDELVITEAGDDGPAELVVRGTVAPLDLVAAVGTRELPAIILEHRYRLDAEATAVELTTRAYPTGAAGGGHDLYDAMFVGGRAPSFIPGRGFVDGQVRGDFVATAGTTTSYGLVYDGAIGLIDLAGIRLVQGPQVDTAGTTRHFVIGDGSVASVTEQAWARRGEPLIAYALRAPAGADVGVVDAGDRLVTVARASAAGDVAVAAPAAAGSLRVQALGTGYVPLAPIALADGAVVERGASGTLAISVRDDAGAPIPARVVIEAPGVERRLLWAGATGELSVATVPGTFTVSISRGLEYDAFVASAVTVTAGQTAPVAAILERVVDTGGWISIDTHLHSELSTDSTFPLDDRLRAVAAEGVEVPISTDHDVITDYGPVIHALGLDAWLGHLIGAEVSSLIWGHLNGYPLAPRGDRSGNGSPSWLARSPVQVFSAIRELGPSAIVQVNHPRDGTTSLFNAIGLDPATGIAATDPATLGLPPDTDLSDLDFDAVEVANASSAGRFEQVFADWLQLVAGGHRACATGSSDSHGPSAYAGEARTYVYVGPGNDDPATIDQDAIVAAIRARRVVVGTGAFVTAGIVTPTGTSLPGETAVVTGDVALHVTVQAPPWRPLRRIRIYQGATEIQVIELDPGDTSTVRFDQTVTLARPPADTFYVVRVDATGSGAPVNDSSMPSFTNPLFVDVP